MNDSSFITLVERYRAGDEWAARRLFDHYFQRLIVIAERKLSGRMKQRTSPEDLVQSAFGSFVRRDRLQPVTLESAGHLWGILQGIVKNKVREHVRFHHAEQRDLRRELAPDGGHFAGAKGSEPSPDVAAAIDEEYLSIVSAMGPRELEVFVLHLAGHSAEAIAVEVARATSRVRHILSDIAVALQKRLGDDS